MTLGERSRPGTPPYAGCPAPGEARAVALGRLFSVLLMWRRALGSEPTAWAAEFEAGEPAAP
ncbi:hypothetical protein [Streptomyces sp. NPDC093094]|uniref:hypothetical protein n=1 Tax=Streptomyces sp. NPDC093094 TaxID=3366026 RepID=UPI0037FF6788